jgi:hypothetical protein
MKITSLFILLITMCNISSAAQNCDWSTIKKMPNGDYEYSPTLNLCVGQLVQDSTTKDQQVVDLTKAIQLKDLAIQTSDSRIALWEKTAGDEQDRLAKMESDEKKSQWLYFGLGILTTFVAGYTASQVYKK